MRKTLSRRDTAALFLFIAVAICIRWLVIRQHNIPFWFDAARDAIVSREIVEQHHLKVQGPNASGTNDTVFHGVLYYYIAGPFYTLLHGDPQNVAMVLGIITAFAILPIFALTYELSGSKRAAFLAAGMYVFSYEAARGGTWLANPTITAVVIPTFAFFLWRTFFRRETKYLPLLGLLLGILTQSAIYLAVTWGEVFLAAWYMQQYGKLKIPLKKWLITFGIYLLSISTMILTEMKMVHLGLLNPHSFLTFSLTNVTQAQGAETIPTTILLYLTKVINTLLPAFPVGSVLLFSFAMFFFWQKNKKTQPRFLFFVIACSWPLLLMSWHFREMFHLFLGLEALILIVIAIWLENLAHSSFGKVAVAMFLFAYVTLQLHAWQTERLLRGTPYFVPQGTYLQEELALVDKTYELSHGQPFTISTMTTPVGYDTLWAYLYSWYGQQKYGRVPSFFGPDQTGIFGGDLLPQVKHPAKIHFSIYESAAAIGKDYNDYVFKIGQDSFAGTPSAKLQFGSMQLEVH